jgi:hypothetical protein
MIFSNAFSVMSMVKTMQNIALADTAELMATVESPRFEREEEEEEEEEGFSAAAAEYQSRRRTLFASSDHFNALKRFHQKQWLKR